jgi:hypothetical protein
MTAELKYRASLTPTVPVSTTVKGSPLTNLEVDGNFKSIANELVTKATTTQVTAAQDAAIAAAVALAIALG